MVRFHHLSGIVALVSACHSVLASVPVVPTLPTPKTDVAGYPAVTMAPALPVPKLDDNGLPPIPVDDPFDEEDPNRTAANMLTPDRIKAMLENEDSVYWGAARRDIYERLAPALQRDSLLRPTGRSIIARSAQRFGAGKRLVALTFDDGPHTATTQQILTILKENGVRATFFFVGAMAERHPELVRAAARAAHSIGNHTFHHVTMIKLSDADAMTEIKACGNVITAVAGVTSHLFRPPGGQYNAQIARGAAALGYNTVLWTCDPGDYLRLKPEILGRRILKTVTPGAIIILHSGVPETVRALPFIIKSLRSAGYGFVTVDEMLASEKSPVRTALSRRHDSSN